MARILLPLLASRAFSAAQERSTQVYLDRQTNDLISSDLYRSHVRPEFSDVERFVHASELSGSAGDESDFFSIDVTEHISKIRALCQQVPDDREALTIPNWNAQYKPLINRALYDFHTDVVSRTTSGNSAIANVVKQLHFFIAVFDAQTVDKIFEVKAKVLRDLDLVEFVRVSGNYTENRPRQLATFLAYAESKFEFIGENTFAETFSREEADDYTLNTVSGLLAIARGLHFFSPDCDLEPFRDMVWSVRTLFAPHYTLQTRMKMEELRSIVKECTSGI
jgi:hypothetical protein